MQYETTPTFENLPKAIFDLNAKFDRFEQLLLRVIPQTDPEQLLTITQAGEIINLTVPTIYSLVSKKLIPFNKKSKRLYFLKSELLEWVKSGRKKTIAECQANPESHLRTPKRRAIV